MTYCHDVKRRAVTFLMAFLMVFATVMMFAGTVVHADTMSASTQDAQARLELTKHVQSKLLSHKYEVDGGGYLSGEDLFEGNTNDGYTIDSDAFNTLTSKAQTQFVSDIADKSYDAVEAKPNVTDSTVQNWWKELQKNDGVGSKFMNEILKNAKPDFVTANAIFQPFSGVVGTALGLGAVMIMAFLGVVMVTDIAYITLPPLRILIADEDNGAKKFVKSKVITHDAIYAVEQSENNSDSGTAKHALGIYLKRRIVALILLGICLLYLVNGQLYTFVGWVLDLVSGFLGF